MDGSNGFQTAHPEGQSAPATVGPRQPVSPYTKSGQRFPSQQQPQPMPAQYRQQFQPHPQPMPVQQPPAPARTPSGWGKFWASLGLGALGFIVSFALQVICSIPVTYVSEDLTNGLMTVCEWVPGLIMVAFVVLLGGKRIATPTTKGLGQAFRAALWIFVIDAVLIGIDIGAVLLGEEPFELAHDWPVRTAIILLLCLGVGIYEETLVRGLCLNGILARFGRTRTGVYGAVIVSSLIFGLMHFDFFVDFSDPLAMSQNLMKVLQTGMVGYLMAAILVKTRNLWAVILIHAANDFLLMFMYYGLTNETVTTEYVATGEEGVATLVMYVLICAMYSPLMVVGTRMIREASPWRGDFYHYDDPAIGQMPNPLAQPVQPVQAAPWPQPGQPGQWPQPGQVAQPGQWPQQGYPDQGRGEASQPGQELGAGSAGAPHANPQDPYYRGE